MKKLLFLFIMMLLPMMASAQKVSDVQNSGCLDKTLEEMNQSLPTIVLTKEGNVLSVQLLNYESYTATTDFNVTSSISDGAPYSVKINVTPIIPDGAEVYPEWVCLFNVSFTIRDLEPNSFYLDCWWYKGLVELTEGEPLVLEYKAENANIGDMSFRLLKVMHKAMLMDWVTAEDELHIPSEVTYEGDTYTVTSISKDAFWNSENATMITVPKTIRSMDLDYDAAIHANPFRECKSLEWIEVEEGCPLLSSVDGVLFAENKTMLLGYPIASPRENYTVPKGVTYIRSGAFLHNKYLRKLVIPEEVTYLGWHLFDDTKSLEELYIRGVLDPNCMSTLFDGMDTKVVVYVQPSEVDKFKAVYKGPVCPLPQTAYYYHNGNKIPLTLNEDKVIVSIPKDDVATSNRIRANVPVLRTINDELFDIFIIPRSDFENLTSKDFWEEDAKSVVLTSSYYTEDNKEIFETPYLTVKLKKEEDADLLDSYAEKYRLGNLGSFSQYQPLWYVLYVTPESEKSPLECANELYESGEFASSVPDFASEDLRVPYRPFIEEDKVWKVGTIPADLGIPVQIVDYYYFDGDTIINGKTCKQMMCQHFTSPNYLYYEYLSQPNYLRYVGAWYEEDEKVYFYDEYTQSMKMKYDFSLAANDTLKFLTNGSSPFIIGPKQTGGLEGFKGVYRDIRMCGDEGQSYHDTFWLEGVGCIRGPISSPCDPIYGDPVPEFLMSCIVGDEVIYFNDSVEDGATPAGARKGRFDFTHTIKTQPKMPRKNGIGDEGMEQSLYGEYSDLLLGIHLDPLDDAYQVSITDESGKVVYGKAVNAGTIMGLNIDISAYPEGRYTVTIENSRESFIGEFENVTTGISDATRLNDKGKMITDKPIYNLQGQRISSLQKGLNIVDGRKVYVR